MCKNKMYRQYYQDCWEVKSEFNKEFVSLWSGWLGTENLHKLDEVTEIEWAQFNNWIRLISNSFSLSLVDCDSETIIEITDIEKYLSTYKQSMEKEQSQFTKYVVPELECIISEEWDYTYIIWHKNNGAVEALKPSIIKSGLHHFK